MKKILYISVNSKSESESSSKTVARKLINEVLNECKYKVPKNTIENCDDNIYKKDEECCHEHKHHHHHHYEVCAETKKDIKCNEEIMVDELKNDLSVEEENVDKLKIDLSGKEEKVSELQKKLPIEPIKEYNVETVEAKAKHKAQVNCDNINEFIKDCCPDKNHKHDKEECCGEKHHHHHHHHHGCCDEDSHYKQKCEEFDTSDWEECTGFVVEEIDLFKDYIPQLTHEFYECRNTLVDGPGPCYEKLTHVQRRDMARIKELAMQFKEADIYIIAAPMWSLLFPAPLKQYLDCVILNGVTAEISKKCCRGTLDDKERKMVFVQSVGGELPIFLKCKLDHSNAYLKDISKFLGISKYTELLVDGTGYTEHERQEAVCEAMKDIPHIAKCLIK
ncbi:MAG: NAD(P)H-dependent oxidoreductase [Sarcina sp.]